MGSWLWVPSLYVPNQRGRVECNLCSNLKQRPYVHSSMLHHELSSWNHETSITSRLSSETIWRTYSKSGSTFFEERRIEFCSKIRSYEKREWKIIRHIKRRVWTAAASGRDKNNHMSSLNTRSARLTLDLRVQRNRLCAEAVSRVLTRSHKTFPQSVTLNYTYTLQRTCMQTYK